MNGDFGCGGLIVDGGLDGIIAGSGRSRRGRDVGHDG